VRAPESHNNKLDENFDKLEEEIGKKVNEI